MDHHVQRPFPSAGSTVHEQYNVPFVAADTLRQWLLAQMPTLSQSGISDGFWFAKKTMPLTIILTSITNYGGTPQTCMFYPRHGNVMDNLQPFPAKFGLTLDDKQRPKRPSALTETLWSHSGIDLDCLQ